jgi:rubrerythrin
MILAKAASRALAAELLNKRKFVALFVTGSERTRGNASECNKVLGTSFDLCDLDIRRMIEDEGMVAPACDKPGEIKPIVPSEIFESADAEKLHTDQQAQEMKWRDELSTGSEDETKQDWCAKYRELESVIDGIARGEVKSSAAQARIINMVTERCFGRVKSEDEDKVLSGVMLLPMIGSGATAMICPRCGYVHEENTDEQAPQS